MDSDVLIVGAGMTGLTAARRFQANRLHAQLFDKGEEIGGRMATRRMGHGSADYGAQFLIAQTPAFRDLLAHWEATGLVVPWASGFAQGSLRPSPNVTFLPRFAAVGGMAALARQHAHGLDVHTGVTLRTVRRAGNAWEIEDETGALLRAPRLLLTTPVPQSLALLAAGGVTLPDAARQALSAVAYDPCLVGIFWVDGDVFLPPPGALLRAQHDLLWIADNQRKGVSANARLITVQTSLAFTQAQWGRSDAEIESAIRSGLQEFLAPAARIVQAEVKRWQFSSVCRPFGQPFLLLPELPGLALAGDAFVGAAMGGVESAFHSGQQAADAMLNRS